MHSRKHRRERQRIAADKFRQRNGRRIPHNADFVTSADAWRNHIAWCRFYAAAQERRTRKTTTTICTGLHRVRLPCGNYATTGNPVTVRIETRAE